VVPHHRRGVSGEDAGGSVPRVAVCIATYRRAQMLRALLDSLAGLRFRGPAPHLFLVVVDNDDAASAARVVDALRGGYPHPILYEVEPERNIALARNRGVALALAEGADWLAFVDDDEVVAADWLERLMAAQARFGAPIVTGPVAPSFPPDAPAWAAAELYQPPPLPTGSERAQAATNNVLVAAGLLRGRPGPFSPAFGLTGGSDVHLFLRLHREGARIVWCAEAVVREWLPRSRMRAGWLLRRAFRVGNTAIWCERTLGDGMGRPWTRLAKTVARLGLGVATLPPALLRGRRHVLAALWNVSYGAGALAAASGHRYTEYRVVHGSDEDELPGVAEAPAEP
jgi:succinoglycan biosynthesis protein ExoM